MLIYKLIARLLLPIRLGVVDGEGGGSGNPSGQSGTQGGEASGGGEPTGSAPGSSQPGGEGAQGEGGEAGADDAEETVVKIGDEELPPAEEAAPWVKELRKKFREQSQELARLRGGQAPQEPAALPPAPGAKPKMSDPEIDFDADKLVAALDKWHEASRKREEAERKARDTQTQEQRAWEQTVAAYQDAGKKLGFADFDDCEAAAIAALSPTQQAIIVQGAESAEKAALIMYSLGRNMKLLQDMAKQADPVKFAFAIADIQRKLVVTKRKPTTKPEPTVPASGAPAGAAMSGDAKKVEELREEAARTGDMTKLMNYQREQRNKQRRAA